MRVQLPAGFEWIDTAGGRALVCRPLEPLALHLFTTREWSIGTGAANGADGWAAVAGAIGVAPARLVRLRQVHGAGIVVRRAGEPPEEHAPLPAADIVLSDDPAVALAIQTADCVPLLIADARSGVVAAAHAGWRGLAAGVPAVAVAAMTREFGSRPEDLVAAVGPSISAARYEVGEDVRAAFEASRTAPDRLATWFPSQTRPGHWLFDGWKAAADQLLRAGLADDRVHGAGLCTAEHDDLFCSYRRDGRGAGRMAAAIRARS
jgi:polyphenol oxidase